MTVRTAELAPGNAYTAWGVVYNELANCSDGVCNLRRHRPLPGKRECGVSLLPAAGHVAHKASSEFGASPEAGGRRPEPERACPLVPSMPPHPRLRRWGGIGRLKNLRSSVIGGGAIPETLGV